MGDFPFRPCSLSRLLNVDPLRFIILYASSAANFWVVVVTVTRNNLPRIGMTYQSGDDGGGARNYAACSPPEGLESISIMQVLLFLFAFL